MQSDSRTTDATNSRNVADTTDTKRNRCDSDAGDVESKCMRVRDATSATDFRQGPPDSSSRGPNQGATTNVCNLRECVRTVWRGRDYCGQTHARLGTQRERVLQAKIIADALDVDYQWRTCALSGCMVSAWPGWKHCTRRHARVDMALRGNDSRTTVTTNMRSTDTTSSPPSHTHTQTQDTHNVILASNTTMQTTTGTYNAGRDLRIRTRVPDNRVDEALAHLDQIFTPGRGTIPEALEEANTAIREQRDCVETRRREEREERRQARSTQQQCWTQRHVVIDLTTVRRPILFTTPVRSTTPCLRSSRAQTTTTTTTTDATDPNNDMDLV